MDGQDPRKAAEVRAGRREVIRTLAITFLAAGLAGCASSVPRTENSTLGCVRAQVRQVPAQLDDGQKHCLASGLVARHCSAGEAWLAGAGKELRDAVTPGDASWADWQQDRRGVQCARAAHDDESIARCCAPDAA